MSDRGSLLALDTGAGEESIRVAVYDRALTLKSLSRQAQTAEEMGERFVAFARGERYRLEALDVALRHASIRSTAETIIASAEKIANWAAPPAPPVVVAIPSEPKLAPKKKVTRKKK